MLGNRNKKDGNDFEQIFCSDMFRNGFWVHNMAQKASGQPADVIAVKGKTSWLIDCKVCHSKRGLALSRIEPNQASSMALWRERVQTEPQFAVRLYDCTVYMIPFALIEKYESKGDTVLSDAEIRSVGTPWHEWVEMVGDFV